MSLAGRVAVVTGASSGIGAALADSLAAAGAVLMLGARRTEALQAICQRIGDAGGRAAFEPTDLADESQATRLVEAAVERFGRIDILINNAAVGTVRTIAEGRTDEWRETIDTNLLGTLFTSRAALRHMLPAGRGDIVNITSASAHEAWPYLSVYAATKAGVHTLSNAMRAEVAHLGIRVMTVEVHNVAGTDFASRFDRSVMRDAVQRWEQLALLRRDSPMIAPADVARAIVHQLEQPDPVSVHHLSIRSRAN